MCSWQAGFSIPSLQKLQPFQISGYRELSASLLHTSPQSLLSLGGITRSAPALVALQVPAEKPKELWPICSPYQLVFVFFFCFWLPGISLSSSKLKYLFKYLSLSYFIQCLSVHVGENSPVRGTSACHISGSPTTLL